MLSAISLTSESSPALAMPRYAVPPTCAMSTIRSWPAAITAQAATGSPADAELAREVVAPPAGEHRERARAAAQLAGHGADESVAPERGHDLAGVPRRAASSRACSIECVRSTRNAAALRPQGRLDAGQQAARPAAAGMGVDDEADARSTGGEVRTLPARARARSSTGRAVGLALAVAEAEALVERPRGDVVLAGVELHVVGALAARELDRGVHQRPPEPLPAPVGHDVELGEVALQVLGPQRRAEAQDGQPFRSGAGQEHLGVVRQQLRDALGDLVRPRAGVVVLGVEVVQEPADRLGVGGFRRADRGHAPRVAGRAAPVVSANAAGDAWRAWWR